MFKLVAYRESVAASQTDNDDAAIQGQGDFVTNAHHAFDRDVNVVGAYASGIGRTRARIDVPDLRDVSAFHIRPLNRVLLPATDYNFCDLRRRPVRIRRNQEVRILTTTDATAGPNNQHTGLIVHDLNWAIPEGDPYIIRATGTTTLVAGAWTLVTLTFDDALKPGRYAIVGAEVLCATGIFFRLSFIGDTYWRPGGICLQDEGQRPYYAFMSPSQGIDGIGMGKWGEFENIFLPTVEILANAADTAETVFFHIRRIAI